MKRLCMVSVMMLICYSVLAQYTIKGKVVSQEGSALKGANVALVPFDKGMATDENGFFSFQVPSGSYQLKVSYIGYQTYEKEIQVNKNIDLTVLLKNNYTELEQIAVMGTRARTDDPITQTNIGLEEIENMYTGQDMSVVLEKLSPSIITYSDAGADIGNYVQFRMRGIDQTRINTTLNGVPLNDMIDQGVFFSNFSDFGNSIQSIQVQRGVGTSTNGTSSYAGAVNFEPTRLNEPNPGLELQLLGGSFGTFRASGELSTGKLKNDLAFYSRFTRTISDGYKDHSGSDSYSFFVSGGYLGAKDVLKVTAFAGKTQNDQSYLPVLRTSINQNPKTNVNSPNDTDDFEQELIQLQYTRVIKDALLFNASLYHGGARGVFPFGTGPTTQTLYGLENKHDGFFSDISYEQGNLSLKAGVHGYLFKRENINSTAPNTSQPDYKDKTNKEEASFFAKIGYKSGAFNFFGDLQLRYVNLAFQADLILSYGGPVPAGGVDASRNWFFANPKVGVGYALDDRSSFYASFGRTGREPTRTDILQGDGSSVNEFNYLSAQDENVVKEEYVNDFEIGYRYETQHLGVVLNYFHMDFENEISMVGALAARSYVALRQNVPDSYRKGVELAGYARLSKQWEVALNAAYLKTNVERFVNASSEVFNDVEHIFSPKWTVNPTLSYSPITALKISLHGRYVSRSFMELANDTDFELEEYFVLNSHVNLEISKHVSFSLTVNNLFDELYFTEGSPVDIDFDGTIEGPGYRVQPPRNFYAQLRLRF